jgi:gamma-resorcylate decarboxylase
MSSDVFTRRDLVGLLAGTALTSAVVEAQASSRTPAPAGGPTLNKITLEEHFVLPAALSTEFRPPGINDERWKHINELLTDVEDFRLRTMDENGIAMQVVSLTTNGVQGEPDPRRAVDMAKAANDWAVEKFTSKHPKRFAAFAAAALQDPDAACKETERAVKQLGLKGVLVNGYSNIRDLDTAEYLDEPKFLPWWQCVESLGVPVYLHPRIPLPSQRRIYEGHDEMLSATWAYGAETAAHALRLMTSGLFDKCPKLQIILGHLGEGLVAMMHRAEQRFNFTPCGKKLDKPLAQYMRDNFYITTSGNFHTPTFKNVIEEMGIDRVMFSIDYPYENTKEGSTWFDQCPLQGMERDKVARLNAQRLLGLPS